MRPSHRLTWILLALALAGTLAPGALAKRQPAPPPTSPTYVAPGPGAAGAVNVEALRRDV
jgi:hypothetical protein